MAMGSVTRLLGVLSLSTALSVLLAQTSAPQWGESVGHWRGTGHILANWTSQRDLPMDILINTDGRVTGSIGDAEIEAGSVSANSGWTRLWVHADYTIEARLRGPLISDDQISRRTYRLHLSRQGSRLVGFGASDGDKSWPAASKEARVQSAKIQITKAELNLVEP